MAIQTFVADTILTAAQMNALQGNDYNQTVSTKTASYTLVAADKGTRIAMNAAGATTITVDTSLFAAGDTLTILNIGAGVCTVTAGTATVSTTGTLALVQNAGGTLYFTSAGVSVFQADGVTAAAASSGLSLISETTFTTVTSVSLPQDTFSSSYVNYKVVLNFSAVVGNTPTLTCRFREAGTDNTASNYKTQFFGLDSAGATRNESANNTTSISIGTNAANNVYSLNFEIAKPQLAQTTNIFGNYMVLTAAGLYIGRTGGASHESNTVFDSMSFISSTASGLTGVVRAYGYANS